MIPYYEDDHCTIYHGDCRDVLPSLAGDVVAARRLGQEVLAL